MMRPVQSTVSPPKPQPAGPTAGRGGESHWVDALADVMERVVPDAITTSILLLVVLFGLSLSLGSGLTATIDAYYRGLWMLLQFTMQMTLILVLSLILGATPAFKNAVIFLSRLPRTQPQVILLAVMAGGFVAYLNWGLSIALAPVIAIHFATQAERKGIKIDFLWLMSVLAGAGAIWQFGLSGSAPLLMATPGNFLEQQAGVMPLTTTIWSPAALILVPSFMVAVVAVGIVFMPKSVRQVSEFPQAARVVAGEPATETDEVPPAARTFAQRLEYNPIVIVPLALGLAAWIYHHFFVRNLSLDINSVNTIVLLLGLVLHGSVHNFTKATRHAVALCWPIVVMYHIYAGLAGLIQYHAGGWISRPDLRSDPHRLHLPADDRAGQHGRRDFHPDERRPVGHPGRRDRRSREARRRQRPARSARLERRRSHGQPDHAVLGGDRRRHRTRRLPADVRLPADLRGAVVHHGRSRVYVSCRAERAGAWWMLCWVLGAIL